MAALVAETLRVDQAAAGALAELIEPHTRGNPYETVELLNALRHEGILAPTSTGWRWDEADVRSLWPAPSWPKSRWHVWRPCRRRRGKCWR